MSGALRLLASGVRRAWKFGCDHADQRQSIKKGFSRYIGVPSYRAGHLGQVQRASGSRQAGHSRPAWLWDLRPRCVLNGVLKKPAPHRLGKLALGILRSLKKSLIPTRASGFFGAWFPPFSGGRNWAFQA